MEFKLETMSLENAKINPSTLHAMALLYNAVEKGWTVKKRRGSYVFTKSHEGKKEVIEETYMLNFIKSNLDLGKIFEPDKTR
jgi:hypothetical protein